MARRFRIRWRRPRFTGMRRRMRRGGRRAGSILNKRILGQKTWVWLIIGVGVYLFSAKGKEWMDKTFKKKG